MYIDCSLYKDFHNYIDTIMINSKCYNIQNLENIPYLKTLYSREIPAICIHKYIDQIINIIYKNDIHIDGLLINIIIIIKRTIKYIDVNSYNIHRLVAVIFMISQKLYDDEHYNNIYWAQICGISLETINAMELDLLKCLEYNIFIKHEEMLSIIRSIKYISL